MPTSIVNANVNTMRPCTRPPSSFYLPPPPSDELDLEEEESSTEVCKTQINGIRREKIVRVMVKDQEGLK